MSTQSIPTSSNPEILIEQVLGNLLVKGSDEPQVVIQADPSELTVEEQDDSLQLSCLGDCNIRLPFGAAIKITAIHGDAHLKYLKDELIIGTIHGSLTLRSVADTRIDTVHGDFSAKEVDGSLHIQSINGNAAAREIMGDCSLHEVQGNLDLRKVDGELLASCNGNIRLRLDLLTGSVYQLSAAGNLHCNLPQDTSAKLILSSGADIIKVKTPDSAQVYRQNQMTLDLGDAQAEMMLSAGGGLYISCDEESQYESFNANTMYSEGFGQQIAQQVEAQISSQLEMISQQLNQQMERLSDQFGRSGMSPEQTEKVLEKARMAGERGTARAQEKLRMAQEKLERKLEATRRLQERRARVAEEKSQAKARRPYGTEGTSTSPPPTHPVEQVSEEERLMILRMLEQKKISLEEADSLLSALEGKE